MRRAVQATMCAVLLTSSVSVAAQQSPPASRPPTPGRGQTPLSPVAPTTPTTPPVPRTFAAPVGLLFNTVRPERVADFEKVVAYLQAALAKTTDSTIRAQANGWRVFRATEPGPNGTVMFVFLLDPTVPGAEYGLGRILADAYPDPAQLQEIWKLYTGSTTSGGSLINLSPVTPNPAILLEPAQPAPGTVVAPPAPERAPAADRAR